MNARLLPRHELPPAGRAAMLQLLARHFGGVDESAFHADLDAKNWVLLCHDDKASLVGFSTMDFQVIEFEGRRESVIYSGDTIMDPRGWHSSLLARAWIEAAWNLHRNHGEGPLWWLLISSGFRTYRLLPVFWKSFLPRHDGDAPLGYRERRDRFATRRFGDGFDPRTGIVSLPNPQTLRPHLAGIPEPRRHNPHIAYFVAANPGHARGDELACLTHLHPDNLTPAGRRVVTANDRVAVLDAPR